MKNESCRKATSFSKISFTQWLEEYELMSADEFAVLESYKQDNYRREYEMFIKGKSQYNR